jgi:chorismate mutase/prephenate dehydratase
VDQSGSGSLDEIRQRIDEVDRQLISLLQERTQLAREIGLVKGAEGRPFFTPERERLIFDRLARERSGILPPERLQAIFREIISAARAAEKPLQIAYWGPPGSYSEMAAVSVFGQSAVPVPCDTITDVFRAVEQGFCDYGVAPLENSIAGVVTETLDQFPTTNVKICSEAFLPIHHMLAGGAADLASVKRVYAGPQPAGQCRSWLGRNLPGARVVNATPTSYAARQAVEDPEGAAIVNRLCVERHEMSLLAEHIEDSTSNRTRFVVLGANEPAPTGSDKTSIMFNLHNRPGQLHEALGAFVRNEVNLLMIESRPAPRSSFEYIFFIDLVGHRSEERVQRALAEVRTGAFELVILGSYPSPDPKLRAE